MENDKNTINALYRHLFDTLADLKADKIKIEKANAIANVAQTIINAGKLECKFIDTVGGPGTGFVPNEEPLPRRENLKLVNRWNTRG